MHRNFGEELRHLAKKFEDSYGDSALRAVTKNNPRNLPCPTCGEPNRLTRLDRAAGYQCNECADKMERGY